MINRFPLVVVLRKKFVNNEWIISQSLVVYLSFYRFAVN